jgi:hypothetical protein
LACGHQSLENKSEFDKESNFIIFLIMLTTYVSGTADEYKIGVESNV